MELLKKAEALRQNLSLVGLLDVVVEICRKIAKSEMLVEPNVSKVTDDAVAAKPIKKKK